MASNIVNFGWLLTAKYILAMQLDTLKTYIKLSQHQSSYANRYILYFLKETDLTFPCTQTLLQSV